MSQPPLATPSCSRNAGCGGGGALDELASTQLGLLPPPPPYFLAAPGVSNSRLHKFQAQPPRKQRTFPQSSGWRKGSSETSLSALNTFPPWDTRSPHPSSAPGLPSCPQHPHPHPYPSASQLGTPSVPGTGPRALPEPAHLFLPIIPQGLSSSRSPLCTWGAE